jgi:hypothetical protein
MIHESLSTIPETGMGCMVFEFIATGFGQGARKPIAALSTAPMGSMKFVAGGSNPERAGFFARFGHCEASVPKLSLQHSRTVHFPDDACGDIPRRAAGESAIDWIRADGIVAKDIDRALAVTVADCMPIWVFDESSGYFGVLHSGWKGTGILLRAIEGICSRTRSDPSSISVILGPAIGSCCYSVPEERVDVFAREFGEETVLRERGVFRLDLRRANTILARRAGVGALLSVEVCTSCETRLGSYRRQGPADFTRMAAICCHIKEETR